MKSMQFLEIAHSVVRHRFQLLGGVFGSGNRTLSLSGKLGRRLGVTGISFSVILAALAGNMVFNSLVERDNSRGWEFERSTLDWISAMAATITAADEISTAFNSVPAGIVPEIRVRQLSGIPARILISNGSVRGQSLKEA